MQFEEGNSWKSPEVTFTEGSLLWRELLEILD